MDGTATPTATTVEELYPRLPSNQVAGQVQMGLLCLQRQAGAPGRVLQGDAEVRWGCLLVMLFMVLFVIRWW